MTIHPVIFFITTILLSTEVLVITLAVISLLVWRMKNLFSSLIIASGTIVLLLCVHALKQLFAVSRPSEALIELSSYAFPSGHAAGAMFLALVLDWFYIQVMGGEKIYTARLLLIFFVCIVSYSRLYLQVHTFEQVLAGLLVGAVVGVISRWAIKYNSAPEGTLLSD